MESPLKKIILLVWTAHFGSMPAKTLLCRVSLYCCRASQMLKKEHKTKPMNSPVMNDRHAQIIVQFLHSIGMDVHRRTIEGDTFLPGITTQDGAIVVDESKLLYPGDLLHEAGHLAVLLPEKRKRFHLDEKDEEMGNEIAAIAWSYAALTHLGLPPEVVFHPDCYQGKSAWFIEVLTGGTATIGVPLLQWMGLCYDKKRALETGAEPYPVMLRWLRINEDSPAASPIDNIVA